MRKKPSNTLRLTSTLHNSTLCDNDIFNELKKMAPDNNESKKDTKHVSNLSDENSAKNQIVFSKKKLLLENELLRKENVLVPVLTFFVTLKFFILSLLLTFIKIFSERNRAEEGRDGKLQ